MLAVERRIQLRIAAIRRLMSTFRVNDFFHNVSLSSIAIAHFAQTIGIAATEVINKS